jgi:hypothetical protein
MLTYRSGEGKAGVRQGRGVQHRGASRR